MLARAVMIAALLLAGCGGCEHAPDAAAIRQSVDAIIDAAETAQLRPLTAPERESLLSAEAEVKRHAAALEQVTR